MDTVEVRPALTFDCPDCGAENFIRLAIIDDPTEAHNQPSNTTLYRVTRKAKCKECQHEFSMAHAPV